MSSYVRAITPGQVSWGSAMSHLRDGLDEVGKLLLKYHEQATHTWEPKVDFKVKIGRVLTSSKELRVDITTNDKRYLYVDQGTKPHIIRAKRAKTLAFPSQFTPKTRPGEIGSGHGSHGGPTVYTQEVHHPGTKPRKFSVEIVKRSADSTEAIMQKAMDKVAKEINRMAAQGGSR
ncbi:MAG: hypothetical protein ABII76_01270 [Pseudomonadota bacterium]